MAAFFERLLAEEDPTRFAAMAESLPEPPPFDDDDGERPPSSRSPKRRRRSRRPPAERGRRRRAAGPRRRGRAPPPRRPRPHEAEPTADARPRPTAEADAERRRRGRRRRAPADSGDLFGIAADEPRPTRADPRLDALGLSPDFAAAEAEAAAFPRRGRQPDDEIPVIADDALAARLAGLVPDDRCDRRPSRTRPASS